MELDKKLCEIEKDLYNLQQQSEWKYRLASHWEIAKYTFLNKDEQNIHIYKIYYNNQDLALFFIWYGYPQHLQYEIEDNQIGYLFNKIQQPQCNQVGNYDVYNQQFSFPLGTMYFCLLTMLWHIPSFSAELAFRTYVSIQAQLFLLYFPNGCSIVEQAGLENIQNKI